MTRAASAGDLRAPLCAGLQPSLLTPLVHRLKPLVTCRTESEAEPGPSDLLSSFTGSSSLCFPLSTLTLLLLFLQLTKLIPVPGPLYLQLICLQLFPPEVGVAVLSEWSSPAMLLHSLPFSPFLYIICHFLKSSCLHAPPLRCKLLVWPILGPW